MKYRVVSCEHGTVVPLHAIIHFALEMAAHRTPLLTAQ